MTVSRLSTVGISTKYYVRTCVAYTRSRLPWRARVSTRMRVTAYPTGRIMLLNNYFLVWAPLCGLCVAAVGH